MQATEVIDNISTHFDGLKPKSSWGETALFYNPGNTLPNGIYFATIKQQNGANDQASDLDRNGVYRLSFGVDRPHYQKLFGDRPARPAKGKIIQGDYDFTALSELMPHPIYGWMSWVQILNPTRALLEEIFPLIEGSYSNAVRKFEQRKKRKA